MESLLIGIHAGLGELGVFAFLWAFIEFLNPTARRLKRAEIAVLLGVIFFFAAWVVGGYYYIEFYGAGVKPLIKAGPLPWAHSIIMETKEHVFLFLPFLSLLSLGLLRKFRNDLLENNTIRKALLWLLGIIVLIGFAMAGLGYVISTGLRRALEAGLL